MLRQLARTPAGRGHGRRRRAGRPYVARRRFHRDARRLDERAAVAVRGPGVRRPDLTRSSARPAGSARRAHRPRPGEDRGGSATAAGTTALPQRLVLRGEEHRPGQHAVAPRHAAATSARTRRAGRRATQSTSGPRRREPTRDPLTGERVHVAGRVADQQHPAARRGEWHVCSSGPAPRTSDGRLGALQPLGQRRELAPASSRTVRPRTSVRTATPTTPSPDRGHVRLGVRRPVHLDEVRPRLDGEVLAQPVPRPGPRRPRRARAPRAPSSAARRPRPASRARTPAATTVVRRPAVRRSTSRVTPLDPDARPPHAASARCSSVRRTPRPGPAAEARRRGPAPVSGTDVADAGEVDARPGRRRGLPARATAAGISPSPQALSTGSARRSTTSDREPARGRHRSPRPARPDRRRRPGRRRRSQSRPRSRRRRRGQRPVLAADPHGEQPGVEHGEHQRRHPGRVHERQRDALGDDRDVVRVPQPPVRARGRPAAARARRSPGCSSAPPASRCTTSAAPAPRARRRASASRAHGQERSGRQPDLER